MILRCRWCNNRATGTVTAKGLDSPIPHCDQCWEAAYRMVHNRTPRKWATVEHQPDLFDLLPE